MTNKSPKVQIQFINQALAQAATNLAQAKQLMHELEESLSAVLPSSRDLPGIIGKFDGTYLVTDDGKKFQVPENYASKSKLVYGDTLKMIEDVSGGMATFKQIERVPRTTLTGVLVKKDGKFVAVTSDGSHLLIPAAVSFHHGVEGDEVKCIVPENERNCAFAALDEIPVRDLPINQNNQIKSEGQTVQKVSEPEIQKVIIKSETSEPPKIRRSDSSVSSGLSKKDEKPKPAEKPVEKPKPIRKAEVKEKVSSISAESTAPVKPLPKVMPQISSVAPVTPAGQVNSILADDDLR